jgi:hypothetical protein
MPADYKTLLGLVREFVEYIDEELGGLEELGAVGRPLYDRARAAIAPSAPKNDPAILHSWPPDPCCAVRLTRAASDGKLDTADFWECPICETKWLPKDNGNVRRWEPVVVIEVLRR